MARRADPIDLYGVVRQELAVNPSPDPGDIAAAVLDQIPDDQLRELAALLLRGFVRNMIGTERSRHLAQIAFAPSRPSLRSAKVVGIREAWRKVLDDRIHVGNSVYRFLRDCSYADLMAAADERERMALANHFAAKRFTGFADLIAQHGVQTFGQLPADVLEAALP